MLGLLMLRNALGLGIKTDKIINGQISFYVGVGFYRNQFIIINIHDMIRVNLNFPINQLSNHDLKVKRQFSAVEAIWQHQKYFHFCSLWSGLLSLNLVQEKLSNYIFR